MKTIFIESKGVVKDSKMILPMNISFKCDIGSNIILMDDNSVEYIVNEVSDNVYYYYNMYANKLKKRKTDDRDITIPKLNLITDDEFGKVQTYFCKF